MLGTFPKAFSKAAISQGYFPKRQLPKSFLATALIPLTYPIASAPIVACGASEVLT